MTPSLDFLFRSPRLRRVVRRCLIVVGGLISLLALAYLEENIRGKNAWMNYRHELEAKGEKLDFKDFIPPPVPDEQNFAMTPLLAGLYDFTLDPKTGKIKLRDSNAEARARIIPWNKMPSQPPRWTTGETTDFATVAMALQGKLHPDTSLSINEAAFEVVQSLKAYQPQLDELQFASHRQFCRFIREYDSGRPITHLFALLDIGWIFQFRASAKLELGQTAEALSDTRMVFYIVDACNDPILSSFERRVELLHYALQPVWEGLAQHKWSDLQLTELQQQLGKYDLLKEYSDVMQAERAHSLAIMDGLRTGLYHYSDSGGASQTEGKFQSWMPSGWFYQNAVTLCALYDEGLLPAIDVVAHRIRRENVLTEAELQRLVDKRFHFYRFFAERRIQWLYYLPKNIGSKQSYVEQAFIACALERFRLKNGKYPETLEVLKAEFVDTIPHDIISGKPLLYRQKDSGGFLLYSVGWNEQDDGGITAIIGPKKSARINYNEGDWVWPEYPAK